jgi:WD40 repeat protein
VAGSQDMEPRLWDLTARNPAANPIFLHGHEAGVTSVGISSDGRWVVTGSQDTTARLWDLTSKDPAANPVILRGHEGSVTSVGFSPDSHWILTGSADKTARLWLLQLNDLIDLARVTAGRNLSRDEWQLYFPGEKYRKTFPNLPRPD